MMLGRINYIESIMLTECGSELHVHHKYHNSTVDLTLLMVMDGSLII